MMLSRRGDNKRAYDRKENKAMEDVAKVNIAFRSHMTEAEAREFCFTENFYKGYMVPRMGLDLNDETYSLDCGEISVSQELFNFWSDLFAEKHGDNPQMRAEFNMAWLMSGPTVDEALHGFEVCASDKFVKFNKEDN